MTTASAPGKLILCGEHAVVYGQPAIAVPVHAVRAYAEVQPSTTPGIQFRAPDLNQHWQFTTAPDHPLSRLTRAVLQLLALQGEPALQITLHSELPIASGMGSSAALGAALVRALTQHFDRALAPDQVSALVWEAERFFHGTPSGIDNAVVSYIEPIWYERRDNGPLIEPITLTQPLTLVIGDTGVRASTKTTVGRVRTNWQADPATSQHIFGAIGNLVQQVRRALTHGDIPAIGPLLNHNQTLLEALDVSSPELERLIQAARAAGAWGAKLAGGGGGGVMFALVDPRQAATIEQALLAAGATRVLETTVHL